MSQPPAVSRRTMVLTTLGAAAAAVGGCVAANPKSSPGAIVFMHGKMSSPNYPPFAAATGSLVSAGYAVATPEMPWSRQRYLSGSLPSAFDQIGREVEGFRKQGFARVLLGGHSIGAGIAVGYAATRGGIDGLVLLAPGHSPEDFTGTTQPSLETARQMVAAGKGRERATFADLNVGVRLNPTLAASDYLTWFDPAGDAEMRNTAKRIPAAVPVFVAIGASDAAALQRLGDAVFGLLPPSPNNRLVRVEGNHEAVHQTASKAAVQWLAETFPAPSSAKPVVG